MWGNRVSIATKTNWGIHGGRGKDGDNDTRYKFATFQLSLASFVACDLLQTRVFCWRQFCGLEKTKKLRSLLFFFAFRRLTAAEFGPKSGGKHASQNLPEIKMIGGPDDDDDG